MNFRPYHILQKNKSQSRPCHIIFFDCETAPISLSDVENKHVLKLGWACYVRQDDRGRSLNPQWFRFTSPDQFWNFVNRFLKDKIKLYLIAHNVGFDFRIVEGFSHTQSLGWKMTGFYNKGMTCLMRFKTGNSTVQVLDMTNFFSMSLERLGALVELPKGDVDFASVSEEDLSVYCKRDVEIMIKAFNVWLAFLDKHDLGMFRHTLPSQAFSGYRHRFMKHPIMIHAKEDVCLLERQAYHGGRTECFRVGRYEKGPYYQLDVNSMYGFQMNTKEYPTKLAGYKDSMSAGSLANKLRNFAVIARAKITTDYPVFITQHNKRNVYPVGTFETVLTTPELLFALKHCLVHEVKEVAWYNKAFIFSAYTEYFHHLKQLCETEDNLAFRKIAKLFMNSLYGKFGQRGVKTTINVNNTPNMPDNHKVWDNRIKQPARIYKIGDKTIYEEKTGESYNSFPGIAAHVTAYARMHLWTLFNVAGRENVFYTDTDCLIVNKTGYDNLVSLLHDFKMGYLKIEHQGDFLEIHAPKDYKLGDKVRRKGIRKNAVMISHNTYEQEQFLGLAGAIRKENPDLVTIKRVRKTLKRKIFSGVVQEDGRIIPFHLPLQPPLLL